MGSLGLTPEIALELKRRQLSFFKERLHGAAMRDDWHAAFRDGYAHLATLKVKDVVNEEQLLASLRRALTSPAVVDAIFPIARDVHERTLAFFRTENAKLGAFVPKDARDAIDVVLERPDLLPEVILRNVFEQEAIEEIVSIVLYDGLKEFNDTVNPFFAEWGLPGIIKRVVPIGSGAILKAVEAVRGEFDKRLDPEIRKFIAAFTRRAKGKIADLVVAKSGEPPFIALRRNVAHFLYEQTVASLLVGIDDGSAKALEKATFAIVLESAARDASWTRVEEAVRDFTTAHGDKKIEEFLAELGVKGTPDFEPLAELTWPYAKLAFESPVLEAYLEKILSEFFDEVTGA